MALVMLISVENSQASTVRLPIAVTSSLQLPPPPPPPPLFGRRHHRVVHRRVRRHRGLRFPRIHLPPPPPHP
jgi:hypothetical protein